MKNWGGFFDPENLNNQLEELEEKLQDPDLWKDHKKLNGLNKDKIGLEIKIHEFDVIETKLADIKDLIKKYNFHKCSYRNLSGGIVAIHSGWKI